MDIAVSTAGILWGVVGGTDEGRELLSGGAETDSEASYRPKTKLSMEKRSALKEILACAGDGEGNWLSSLSFSEGSHMSRWLLRKNGS
jgi:hypothetical protein